MKSSRNGNESSTIEKGFRVLTAVSGAAASGKPLEDVLQLAVTVTAEALSSKICSVMLLDSETNMLSVAATQSASDVYRRKPSIRAAQSLSGLTVREKKPLTVRDVRADGRFGFPSIAAAEGLVSLLSVPMLFRGKVIGVVNAYADRERVFTPEEVSLLQAVANECASAVACSRILSEKAAAEEALAARKTVDRAKALLMKSRGLSEPEAHREMQKQSMNRCKPLKDIAEAILLAEDIGQGRSLKK
jgi:signal transduction protein with GAF and PtsI domain